MTVDLAALPAPLAGAVRAAWKMRTGFVPKPLVSLGPDPVLAVWTADVIDSGDLDKAIAEIASSDSELHS